MCTTFVLINKRGVADFASQLAINASSLVFGSHFGPGSTISTVIGKSGSAQAVTAIWWLYLQQTAGGLKPHKDYFSVNTNFRKLPQKKEFKTHRCIVPASAIVESQNGKNPHLLEPADGSLFALGGLWKEWQDNTTGEVVLSASVITLQGHPSLADIHSKSTPLWLPQDAFQHWLDPDITDTRVFDILLEPALRKPLKATPIDRAGTKNPIGEPFIIAP